MFSWVVAPYGVRGLKLGRHDNMLCHTLVAPHGGAWIETLTTALPSPTGHVAPYGGVWIGYDGAVGCGTQSRDGAALGAEFA